MGQHEDNLQMMRISGSMLFGGILGAGVSVACFGMDFGLLGGIVSAASSTAISTVYEMFN